LDTLKYDPLDLKYCYCNVFDHVYLKLKINRGHFKFSNASYYDSYEFVFDAETIPT